MNKQYNDIVIRSGLDGLGIESRWGVTFSAPVQTCPVAQSSTSYKWVPSPFQGYSGQIVPLATYPI
jgi:hypothetical protein